MDLLMMLKAGIFIFCFSGILFDILVFAMWRSVRKTDKLRQKRSDLAKQRHVPPVPVVSEYAGDEEFDD